MTRRPHRLHGRRAARAFTLVEMLIAIGIVVLLVALTVTAATALVHRSEVSATENVLKLLDMTLKEYETDSDREVLLGPLFNSDATGCNGWDLRVDTPPLLQTTFLIGSTMYRRMSSRAIFAQVDDDYLLEIRRTGGTLPPWFAAEEQAYLGDVCFSDAAPNPGAEDTDLKWFAPIDTWGNPIRLIYPGRVPDVRSYIGSDQVIYTYPIDGDGTMFTELERQLGRAVGRRTAFVSAGPDGQIGDLHLDVAESSLTDDQRADVKRAADNVYSYTIDRERPQ